MQAVEFSKGDYTALLIPGMGANLIRLTNTRLGAEILRAPADDEVETFKGRPHVFGLPIRVNSRLTRSISKPRTGRFGPSTHRRPRRRLR